MLPCLCLLVFLPYVKIQHHCPYVSARFGYQHSILFIFSSLIFFNIKQKVPNQGWKQIIFLCIPFEMVHRIALVKGNQNNMFESILETSIFQSKI